jgi:hypothetical protein
MKRGKPFYSTDYAREHAKDAHKEAAAKPVCPACDLSEMLKNNADKNKSNPKEQK